MGRRAAKSDQRLLGSWKSDRRATIRHFVPKPGADPAAISKLKTFYGKLLIRWGRGKCYTDLDGFRQAEDYEVVARDSQSVVVRIFDTFFQEHRLIQIHFEGQYYWLWAWGMREFFRRVQG